VANFTNLVVNTAGSYTFTATPSSISGVSTAVNSNAFTVSPAAASTLVFTQSPANSLVSQAFGTQPAVSVEDSYGNVVATNTSTVTLAITSGTPTSGGPGTLTCSGGAGKAASAGVATFAGCSINTAGANYKLHATDGSLTVADSSAFNVSTPGTYSGSSSGNIPSTNTYYLINAASTGSGTSTANTLAPGVAETLTGLTFTINSTSGTNHTATVGIVTSGTWAATALTCTIPSGSTSCTITTNVPVSATQSINIRAVGNGLHPGIWTTTYTQP
jgi:hypothetical protein